MSLTSWRFDRAAHGRTFCATDRFPHKFGQGFPKLGYSATLPHRGELCRNLYRRLWRRTKSSVIHELIVVCLKPYITKHIFEHPNPPVKLAGFAIGDGSLGSLATIEELPAVCNPTTVHVFDVTLSWPGNSWVLSKRTPRSLTMIKMCSTISKNSKWYQINKSLSHSCAENHGKKAMEHTMHLWSTRPSFYHKAQRFL